MNGQMILQDIKNFLKDTEHYKVKVYEYSIQAKEEENKSAIEKENTRNPIEVFKIEDTKVIPFDFYTIEDGLQREAAIEERIKKLRATHEIMAYLQESQSEQKGQYIKLLEKYNKGLEKFIDFDATLEVEEETSEDLTADFASLLEDKFINLFMVGLYRSLKYAKNEETELFAKGFIEKINTYLRDNGIYTRNIVVGNKLQDKDYEDMINIPRKTEIQEEHELITEVETLPYYVRFLDIDGEEEQICIKGRCYSLSNKMK